MAQNFDSAITQRVTRLHVSRPMTGRSTLSRLFDAVPLVMVWPLNKLDMCKLRIKVRGSGIPSRCRHCGAAGIRADSSEGRILDGSIPEDGRFEFLDRNVVQKDVFRIVTGMPNDRMHLGGDTLRASHL